VDAKSFMKFELFKLKEWNKYLPYFKAKQLKSNKPLVVVVVVCCC
jgi:hypothetical protein